MHQRRGQAAMEFLITYGWAILAAIVAIGVLAYFLSSPGRLTANSCTVAAPFNCNAGLASVSSNNVQLELRNGGGESFDLRSVAVSGCSTNTTVITAAADSLTAVMVAPCSPALTAGNTFRGDITITYRKAGSSLDQVSTGRIIQRL